MDPIDSLTRLIATLRRQSSASADGAKASASKGRTDDTAVLHGSGKPSIDQLKRRITERLHMLDAHSDEHRRRAARVFLEAVLTWEFGDELLRDARFAEMVQEVESQMRSDPGLAKTLDTLLQQMMEK